jgi:effector-binding domain-containing protein
MPNEPRIEYREAQNYAAIRASVRMQEIPTLPPLIGETMGYLQQIGVTPDGPPFFRYLEIDMERELVMEVGWPVAAPVPGNGRVSGGAFPAGNYAVVVHHGHPGTLVDATRDLLRWAEANGVAWKMENDGKTWSARIEFYLTDPAVQPDMNEWDTELAFLTAIPS